MCSFVPIVVQFSVLSQHNPHSYFHHIESNEQIILTAMCVSESEIRERLKDLPETPCGLISMMEPGDFHGIVDWKIIKGKMISFRTFDHPNCEEYHTRFSKNTEVSWHTHGCESDENILCLSGELNIIFEDGTNVILKERDQCDIKKQVKHMAIISNKPCEILARTIPKEK